MPHAYKSVNLILLPFLSELSPDCLIVRDHYHLKNSIWPKQLGENLYNHIKEHPKSALNCTTKEEFEYHVQQTYIVLSSYPLHVAYFKKWFDKPKSIAKYEIIKNCGSLCTISSSNSESLNSSNKSFMPTKTMGIMTPEVHTCMN